MTHWSSRTFGCLEVRMYRRRNVRPRGLEGQREEAGATIGRSQDVGIRLGLVTAVGGQVIKVVCSATKTIDRKKPLGTHTYYLPTRSSPRLSSTFSCPSS